MSNLLKTNTIFALAAISAMLVAPAFGQSASNVLPFSGGAMKSISAEETIAMLAELEIAGEIQADGVNQAFVVATTPGGAKFLVQYFACSNPAAVAGCASAVVSTAFSNAGISYDDLNTFNGSSIVTTAINSPENQVVVFGRHMIVQGGVTRENFETVLALFLVDMQTFVQGQLTAGTAVSLKSDRASKSKIEGFAASGGTPATTVLVSKGLAAETGVAIHNQWSADFMTDAARARVK